MWCWRLFVCGHFSLFVWCVGLLNFSVSFDVFFYQIPFKRYDGNKTTLSFLKFYNLKAWDLWFTWCLKLKESGRDVFRKLKICWMCMNVWSFVLKGSCFVLFPVYISLQFLFLYVKSRIVEKSMTSLACTYAAEVHIYKKFSFDYRT